jgi:hypothetical protein
VVSGFAPCILSSSRTIAIESALAMLSAFAFARAALSRGVVGTCAPAAAAAIPNTHTTIPDRIFVPLRDLRGQR